MLCIPCIVAMEKVALHDLGTAGGFIAEGWGLRLTLPDLILIICTTYLLYFFILLHI